MRLRCGISENCFFVFIFFLCRYFSFCRQLFFGSCVHSCLLYDCELLSWRVVVVELPVKPPDTTATTGDKFETS